MLAVCFCEPTRCEINPLSHEAARPRLASAANYAWGYLVIGIFTVPEMDGPPARQTMGSMVHSHLVLDTNR
jgi:hypothetical protein